MLLVTNQLQYAPEADTVLYLEEGEMVACGKYDEVVQNEGFASLLNEYEVICQRPCCGTAQYRKSAMRLCCNLIATASRVVTC